MTLRNLAFLVILLLPLLPANATAATVLPARGLLLDWPLGSEPVIRITVAPAHAPIARVRFLTLDIILLPTGRTVATLVSSRMIPAEAASSIAQPFVLPLPGALPLMIGALAGLMMIARRRAPAGLVRPDAPP